MHRRIDGADGIERSFNVDNHEMCFCICPIRTFELLLSSSSFTWCNLDVYLDIYSYLPTNNNNIYIKKLVNERTWCWSGSVAMGHDRNVYGANTDDAKMEKKSERERGQMVVVMVMIEAVLILPPNQPHTRQPMQQWIMWKCFTQERKREGKLKSHM